MRCPYCDNQSTNVLTSRVVKQDGSRVRKRECPACGVSFFTDERLREALPRVVKRDERREPFDLDKLRRGIEVAVHKRPISSDSINEIVEQIAQALRRRGRTEVLSSDIGDAVMFFLGDMDTVAYIRFASVYRSFSNPDQFGELANIVKHSVPTDIAMRQRTLPLGFGMSKPDDTDHD